MNDCDVSCGNISYELMEIKLNMSFRNILVKLM